MALQVNLCYWPWRLLPLHLSQGIEQLCSHTLQSGMANFKIHHLPDSRLPHRRCEHCSSPSLPAQAGEGLSFCSVLLVSERCSCHVKHLKYARQCLSASHLVCAGVSKARPAPHRANKPARQCEHSSTL